jgi:NAD(P)-binding Rossmann-like domain
MHTVDADYLVVGAGAMGMAFIDTLVGETEARVVLVDRRHLPGGHWTMAYPFVWLHQPSAFYGVNPLSLGCDYHRPGRLERGALRVGDRRRGLRVLRPRPAPAVPADRARLLLPDERIPG